MNIITKNESSYMQRYNTSLQKMSDDYDVMTLDTFYEDINRNAPEEGFIPENVRFLVIIGIADGIFLSKLLNSVSDTVKILLYEPYVESFLYACSYCDLSDLILRENVTIVLGKGEPEKELYEPVKSLANILNIKYMFGIVIPGYETLYPGILSKVTESIKNILLVDAAEYATFETYRRTGFINEIFALSALHKSVLAGNLINMITDKNIPIILVGAGPSLDKNVEMLKNVGEHGLIIACTRAMKTLERCGVKADLVAMADMEEGHDYCEHDESRDYNVLFHVQSAKDIQEKYLGKGIYFGFNRAIFPISGLCNELDGINTGGSVITCVFSFFLQSGFRRFILVGEDLAFSNDGSTHAGTEQENAEEDVYEVQGIDGKTVLSRTDWVIFRKFFEQEIEKNGDLEVIDATEGGALIKGSKIMSLKDAISSINNRVFPIENWLSEMPRGCEGDINEVRSLFENILSGLFNMLQILKEAKLWNQRIQDILPAAEQNASFYNRACSVYNELYQKIIDFADWDMMQNYASDIYCEYADQAQLLGRNTDVTKRLILERGFFEKLIDADEELVKCLSDGIERLQ